MVIQFCFRVVFTFRISSLPPLFVFPSCLIKPPMSDVPQNGCCSLNTSKQINTSTLHSKLHLLCKHCIMCAFQINILYVSRADMSALLHLDFELPTSKTKQNTPHWPGGIRVPCLRGCKYSFVKRSTLVVCACYMWVLISLDWQTNDWRGAWKG